MINWIFQPEHLATALVAFILGWCGGQVEGWFAGRKALVEETRNQIKQRRRAF